ncbi:ATP-binding protein [Paenibacillus sp. CGMCC 1.16610]|uniref:AAA family ATPase n=1 Tax=Paenibacillus anseongense TaxID=2682845 RepID=A0ABW9U3A4_9BACL|nr:MULTISPECIES: ATP-binding protein [Paenibacillus]MBA2937065.1 ATP-binding protein [Paenibacillus sp. CGMCC 1.16610]MVQ33388.1 AAA family ATPase [Paenibacillus anseongense]
MNNLDDEEYLTGYHCDAVYKKQVIPENQGNAFIEAIPDRLNAHKLYEALYSAPRFKGDVSKLDIEDRLALVQQIRKSFWLPLSGHFYRYRQYYNMIKIGYQSRNPYSPSYNRQYALGLDKVFNSGVDEEGRNIAGVNHTAEGFADIGLSGMGKSVTNKRILQLFPQVIHHKSYKGRQLTKAQVVWLHVECPSSKSVSQLSRNFFAAVDKALGSGSNFFEKFGEKAGTIEVLAQRMVKVANQINLGVLLIDEIQKVHRAHSGGDERMIEFITELTNTIGIPVVIVGNLKSLYLFKSSLANSRRAIPDSYVENITDRMVEGELNTNGEKAITEWDDFIEALWEFQYTLSRVPLTEEFKSQMYYHCIGIPDIAVKLFMHVQCQAIVNGGDERITQNLINSVASKSLKLLQPMFERVRRGESAVLIEFENKDIHWTEFNEYFKEAAHRVYVHGKLAQEHERAIQQKNRMSILEDLIAFTSKMSKSIEEAESIAQRVFESSNGMGDLNSMYQHVAKLVMESQETSTRSQTKNKVAQFPKLKKNKGELPLMDISDIRYIVKAGEQKKMSIEESLLDADLIKDPLEFNLL